MNKWAIVARGDLAERSLRILRGEPGNSIPRENTKHNEDHAMVVFRPVDDPRTVSDEDLPACGLAVDRIQSMKERGGM